MQGKKDRKALRALRSKYGTLKEHMEKTIIILENLNKEREILLKKPETTSKSTLTEDPAEKTDTKPVEKSATLSSTLDLKQKIANIVNKENLQIVPNITPRDATMVVPPITPKEITRAIKARPVNIPLLEIPDPSVGSLGPLSTDSTRTMIGPLSTDRRTVSNAIDLKSEIALLGQSLAKLSVPSRGSMSSRESTRFHHHTKTLSNPFLKTSIASSNPLLFESIDVVPCEPLRPQHLTIHTRENSLLKNPIISPTS